MNSFSKGIFGAALSFILLGIIDYALFSEKTGTDHLLRKQNNAIANFLTVSNSVKRRKQGFYGWDDANLKMPLLIKDSIFVGEKSEARIEISQSSNVIELGENSIIILDIEESTVAKGDLDFYEFKLLSGQLKIAQGTTKKIGKQKPKTMRLALADGTKIQFDQDTELKVASNKSKQIIMLERGKIKVQKSNASGKIIEKNITVESGESIQISQNQKAPTVAVNDLEEIFDIEKYEDQVLADKNFEMQRAEIVSQSLNIKGATNKLNSIESQIDSADLQATVKKQKSINEDNLNITVDNQDKTLPQESTIVYSQKQNQTEWQPTVTQLPDAKELPQTIETQISPPVQKVKKPRKTAKKAKLRRAKIVFDQGLISDHASLVTIQRIPASWTKKVD